MKRKILVTLLAFCLIASLCVVGAAAAAGEPCEGGESCDHEAAIGDVHYASLNDALQYNARPGDTIVVLKDCEINFYNPKNNSILDLNGHNVEYSGEEPIRFSGKGRSFSIVDSSAEVGTQGGTFRATGERDMAEAVFQISGGATFNVNNINIESNGCSIYPLQNNTSVNIKDSKIESSGVYCISTNAATKDNYGVIINISGSTLTTNANDYDNCAVMFNVGGSLNIENSSITGDRQAVLVRAGNATIVNSDITVTGEWLKSNGNTDSRDTGAWSSGNEVPSAALIVGNYYSGAADAYLANANVTVEDTVVTAQGSAPAVYVDGNTTYYATLEMTGEGTSVTGPVKIGKQTSAEATDITVTGGTFTGTNINELKEYFPTNSALTFDKNGKVVTDDATAVAEVNNVPYKTLQAAIDAAEGGDTVVITNDVTLAANERITLDKCLTIEGITDSVTVTGSCNTDNNSGLFTFGAGSEGSTLRNFTINYTSTGFDTSAVYFTYGFDGESSEVTRISDVTFVGEDDVSSIGQQSGILATYLTNDSAVEITGCSFTNFKYAIYVNGMNNVTISNNIINGTRLGGIIFAGDSATYPCDNITVEDNTLTNINVSDYEDGIYSSGVSIGTNASDVAVNDNDITMANGLPVYCDSETDNFIVTYVVDGKADYTIVASGDSVYLPTLSKSGYTFTGWRVNNSNTIVKGGESYTITANTTFTAVWNMIMIPDTYDIAVDQPAHGTVDVSLSNASQGSVITVTATPDEGYELVYITVDGEPISGNSFVMPDHAVEVSAVFAEIGKEVNFVDVSRADWFYDYVQYVAQNGLMEGTTRTAFEPNASMTRAMFWTVLARIDGETITGDAWKTLAQTWAVESGISDGTNADALITREQMVTMLYRYAGSPVTGGMAISEFTDGSSVSDYATDAVTWALSEGILTGMGDGILAPQGTATRAQAAAMLMRFVEA